MDSCVSHAVSIIESKLQSSTGEVDADTLAMLHSFRRQASRDEALHPASEEGDPNQSQQEGANQGHGKDEKDWLPESERQVWIEEIRYLWMALNLGIPKMLLDGDDDDEEEDGDDDDDDGEDGGTLARTDRPAAQTSRPFGEQGTVALRHHRHRSNPAVAANAATAARTAGVVRDEDDDETDDEDEEEHEEDAEDANEGEEDGHEDEEEEDEDDEDNEEALERLLYRQFVRQERRMQTGAGSSGAPPPPPTQEVEDGGSVAASQAETASALPATIFMDPDRRLELNQILKQMKHISGWSTESLKSLYNMSFRLLFRHMVFAVDLGSNDLTGLQSSISEASILVDRMKKTSTGDFALHSEYSSFCLRIVCSLIDQCIRHSGSTEDVCHTARLLVKLAKGLRSNGMSQPVNEELVLQASRTLASISGSLDVDLLASEIRMMCETTARGASLTRNAYLSALQGLEAGVNTFISHHASPNASHLSSLAACPCSTQCRRTLEFYRSHCVVPPEIIAKKRSESILYSRDDSFESEPLSSRVLRDSLDRLVSMYHLDTVHEGRPEEPIALFTKATGSILGYLAAFGKDLGLEVGKGYTDLTILALEAAQLSVRATAVYISADTITQLYTNACRAIDANRSSLWSEETRRLWQPVHSFFFSLMKTESPGVQGAIEEVVKLVANASSLEGSEEQGLVNTTFHLGMVSALICSSQAREPAGFLNTWTANLRSWLGILSSNPDFLIQDPCRLLWGVQLFTLCMQEEEIQSFLLEQLHGAIEALDLPVAAVLSSWLVIPKQMMLHHVNMFLVSSYFSVSQHGTKPALDIISEDRMRTWVQVVTWIVSSLKSWSQESVAGFALQPNQDTLRKWSLNVWCHGCVSMETMAKVEFDLILVVLRNLYSRTELDHDDPTNAMDDMLDVKVPLNDSLKPLALLSQLRMFRQQASAKDSNATILFAGKVDYFRIFECLDDLAQVAVGKRFIEETQPTYVGVADATTDVVKTLGFQPSVPNVFAMLSSSADTDSLVGAFLFDDFSTRTTVCLALYHLGIYLKVPLVPDKRMVFPVVRALSIMRLGRENAGGCMELEQVLLEIVQSYLVGKLGSNPERVSGAYRVIALSHKLGWLSSVNTKHLGSCTKAADSFGKALWKNLRALRKHFLAKSSDLVSILFSFDEQLGAVATTDSSNADLLNARDVISQLKAGIDMAAILEWVLCSDSSYSEKCLEVILDLCRSSHVHASWRQGISRALVQISCSDAENRPLLNYVLGRAGKEKAFSELLAAVQQPSSLSSSMTSDQLAPIQSQVCNDVLSAILQLPQDNISKLSSLMSLFRGLLPSVDNARVIQFFEACLGRILDFVNSCHAKKKSDRDLQIAYKSLEQLASLLFMIGSVSSPQASLHTISIIRNVYMNRLQNELQNMLRNDALPGQAERSSEANCIQEDAKIVAARENHVCTYISTGSQFVEQHWYFCHTCGLVGSEGVCAVCVIQCHWGHDVSYSRCSRFFCDCGAALAAAVGAVSASSDMAIPPPSIAPRSRVSCRCLPRESLVRGSVPLEPSANWDLGSFIAETADGLREMIAHPRSTKGYYGHVNWATSFDGDSSSSRDTLALWWKRVRNDPSLSVQLVESVSQRDYVRLFVEAANYVLSEQSHVLQCLNENTSNTMATPLTPSSEKESVGQHEPVSTWSFSRVSHLANVRRKNLGPTSSTANLMAWNLTDTLAVVDDNNAVQLHQIPLAAYIKRQGDAWSWRKFMARQLNSYSLDFEPCGLKFDPNTYENRLAIWCSNKLVVLEYSAGFELASFIPVELGLESDSAQILVVEWVSGAEGLLLVGTSEFLKVYDLMSDSFCPVLFLETPPDKRDMQFEDIAPMARLDCTGLEEFYKANQESGGEESHAFSENAVIQLFVVASFSDASVAYVWIPNLRKADNNSGNPWNSIAGMEPNQQERLRFVAQPLGRRLWAASREKHDEPSLMQLNLNFAEGFITVSCSSRIRGAEVQSTDSESSRSIMAFYGFSLAGPDTLLSIPLWKKGARIESIQAGVTASTLGKTCQVQGFNMSESEFVQGCVGHTLARMIQDDSFCHVCLVLASSGDLFLGARQISSHVTSMSFDDLSDKTRNGALMEPAKSISDRFGLSALTGYVGYFEKCLQVTENLKFFCEASFNGQRLESSRVHDILMDNEPGCIISTEQRECFHVAIRHDDPRKSIIVGLRILVGASETSVSKVPSKITVNGRTVAEKIPQGEMRLISIPILLEDILLTPYEVAIELHPQEHQADSLVAIDSVAVHAVYDVGAFYEQLARGLWATQTFALRATETVSLSPNESASGIQSSHFAWNQIFFPRNDTPALPADQVSNFESLLLGHPDVFRWIQRSFRSSCMELCCTGLGLSFGNLQQGNPGSYLDRENPWLADLARLCMLTQQYCGSGKGFVGLNPSETSPALESLLESEHERLLTVIGASTCNQIETLISLTRFGSGLVRNAQSVHSRPSLAWMHKACTQLLVMSRYERDIVRDFEPILSNALFLTLEMYALAVGGIDGMALWKDDAVGAPLEIVLGLACSSDPKQRAIVKNASARALAKACRPDNDELIQNISVSKARNMEPSSSLQCEPFLLSMNSNSCKATVCKECRNSAENSLWIPCSNPDIVLCSKCLAASFKQESAKSNEWHVRKDLCSKASTARQSFVINEKASQDFFSSVGISEDSNTSRKDADASLKASGLLVRFTYDMFASMNAMLRPSFSIKRLISIHWREFWDLTLTILEIPWLARADRLEIVNELMHRGTASLTSQLRAIADSLQTSEMRDINYVVHLLDMLKFLVELSESDLLVFVILCMRNVEFIQLLAVVLGGYIRMMDSLIRDQEVKGSLSARSARAKEGERPGNIAGLETLSVSATAQPSFKLTKSTLLPMTAELLRNDEQGEILRCNCVLENGLQLLGSVIGHIRTPSLSGVMDQLKIDLSQLCALKSKKQQFPFSDTVRLSRRLLLNLCFDDRVIFRMNLHMYTYVGYLSDMLDILARPDLEDPARVLQYSAQLLNDLDNIHTAAMHSTDSWRGYIATSNRKRDEVLALVRLAHSLQNAAALRLILSAIAPNAKVAYTYLLSSPPQEQSDSSRVRPERAAPRTSDANRDAARRTRSEPPLEERLDSSDSQDLLVSEVIDLLLERPVQAKELASDTIERFDSTLSSGPIGNKGYRGDLSLLENIMLIFLFSSSRIDLREVSSSILYELCANVLGPKAEPYAKTPRLEILESIVLRAVVSISTFGSIGFEFVCRFVQLVQDPVIQKRLSPNFIQQVSGTGIQALTAAYDELKNHPRSHLYRALGSLMELKSFYLESDVCLTCSSVSSVSTFAKTLPLDVLRQEAKYSDRSIFSRLALRQSVSSIKLKSSHTSKQRKLKQINIYFSQLMVGEASLLKRADHPWIFAESFILHPQHPSEMQLDFPIPFECANLRLDFVEAEASHDRSRTEELMCPRCARPVSDRYGVCSICHDNAYQCKLCRNINYENLDSFLCNACGYCKHGKYEFFVAAATSFVASKILNEADRKKTIKSIESEMQEVQECAERLEVLQADARELVFSRVSDPQSPASVLVNRNVSFPSAGGGGGGGNGGNGVNGGPPRARHRRSREQDADDGNPFTRSQSDGDNRDGSIGDQEGGEDGVEASDLETLLRTILTIRRDPEANTESRRSTDLALNLLLGSLEGSFDIRAARARNNNAAQDAEDSTDVVSDMEGSGNVNEASGRVADRPNNHLHNRPQGETEPAPKADEESSKVIGALHPNIRSLVSLYGSTMKDMYLKLSRHVRLLESMRAELLRFSGVECNGWMAHWIDPLPEQNEVLPNMQGTKVEPRLPENRYRCFGCSLAVVTHNLMILSVFGRAFDTSRRAILSTSVIQKGLECYSLLDGSELASESLLSLITSAASWDRDLNASLCETLFDRVVYSIDTHLFANPYQSSANGMWIFERFMMIEDACWEDRFRVVLRLLFYATKVALDSAYVAETVILPCLRIANQLSERDSPSADAVWSSHKASRGISSRSGGSISNEEAAVCGAHGKLGKDAYTNWLSKTYSFNQWLSEREQADRFNTQDALGSGLSANSWLIRLLSSSGNLMVRSEASKLLKTLYGDDVLSSRKILDIFVLDILESKPSCGDQLAQYFGLCNDLINSFDNRRYLVEEDLLTKCLDRVDRETIALVHQGSSFAGFQFLSGYTLNQLIALLKNVLSAVGSVSPSPSDPNPVGNAAQTLILTEQQSKHLATCAMRTYLNLQNPVVMKNPLIDECVETLAVLLNRKDLFYDKDAIVEISTTMLMESLRSHDRHSLEILLSYLRNLICPDRREPVCEMVLRKSSTQEEFIRGHMARTPYASTDIGGSLMRDVKNKICHDLELTGLLDDDFGMELLVGGKLIKLDLPIHRVYEHVWLPSLSSSGDRRGLGGGAHHRGDERPPMVIIYRLAGLDGEATEPIVDRLEPCAYESVDKEQEYKDTVLFAKIGGLSVILDLLSKVRKWSSEHEKLLIDPSVRILSAATELRVNRHSLLHIPDAIGVLVDSAAKAFAEDTMEAVNFAETLLSVSEKALNEYELVKDDESFVSATLSDGSRREEASVEVVKRLEVFLRQLDSISARAGKTLLRVLPFLARNSQEAAEAIFDYIAPRVNWEDIRLLAVSSSTASSTNREDPNKLSGLDYLVPLLDATPPNKFGRDIRHQIVLRGHLKSAFEIVYTAFPLPRNAHESVWFESLEERSIVAEVVEFCKVSVRADGADGFYLNDASEIGAMVQDHVKLFIQLESVSSSQNIGVLCEELLDYLKVIPSLEDAIVKSRQEQRESRKQAAQASREAALRQVKSGASIQQIENSSSAAATPFTMDDFVDEVGPACVVCGDGFRSQPSECLALYVYSKREARLDEPGSSTSVAVDYGNIVSVASLMEFLKLSSKELPAASGLSRQATAPSFDEASSKPCPEAFSSLTHFNAIHIACHKEALRGDRALRNPRDEWEGATLRNTNTKCNNLLPILPPLALKYRLGCDTSSMAASSDTSYRVAMEGFYDRLVSIGISRDSPLTTLLIYDLALFLGRVSLRDVSLFSAETSGGGIQSNLSMSPFLLQMLLYLFDRKSDIYQSSNVLRSSEAEFCAWVLQRLRKPAAGHGTMFHMACSLFLLSLDEWLCVLPRIHGIITSRPAKKAGEDMSGGRTESVKQAGSSGLPRSVQRSMLWNLDDVSVTLGASAGSVAGTEGPTHDKAASRAYTALGVTHALQILLKSDLDHSDVDQEAFQAIPSESPSNWKTKLLFKITCDDEWLKSISECLYVAYEKLHGVHDQAGWAEFMSKFHHHVAAHGYGQGWTERYDRLWKGKLEQVEQSFRSGNEN